VNGGLTGSPDWTKIPPLRRKLAAIFFISAAFAHNLSYTWLKWGDAVIDNGREIDCARQLAEGRQLYGEVRYLFGPLAPLVNATLFKIFGVHLDVLIFAGVLSAALMCWVIYRLCRRFTDRGAATLITIAFLYICAFAHLTNNAIFNFVLPYSNAATYGCLVGLASLLFLVRHAQQQKARDFWLAAGCLGLSALTKVEIIFGVAVLHSAFVIGTVWMKRFSRMHMLGYGAAAALVTGVYGYFTAVAGRDAMYGNLLFQFFSTNNQASSLHMGLMDPLGSLIGIAYSFAAMGGVLGCCVVLTRLVPPKDGKLAPVHLLAALAGFLVYFFLSLEYPFRLLNFTAATVCLVYLWRWIKHAETRETILPQALVWTYAVASAARLGLKVVSYHYGFFLLPAALVAFGLLWFAFLPRWFRPGAPANPIYRAAGTGVLLALIVSHYSTSAYLYSLHTATVQMPRGTIHLLDLPQSKHGTAYASAMWLLSKMPPETQVVVMPQGAQLSFLTARDNPIGWFGFTEPELVSIYDDAHLLEELKRTRPEIVIFSNADISDINENQFGVHYAVKSWAWVEENYTLGVGLGPRKFLKIYARNDFDIAPYLRQAKQQATDN
jgi:hypothetical protein